jgi:uncharacterized membrane protein YdbT with pleckstrin-like domain
MSDEYLKNLLGEREQILLVTHQHWFKLLQSILLESILIIATIVLVSLIWALFVPNIIVALGYLLLIVPIFSLVRDVLIWENHKYIVTTRRVIQVFGVVNKNITDSSLEKVNDVKMDQSFWGRIFNFGDVEILTASELGINRFTTIGDPVHFKTAMLNAKIDLESNSDVLGRKPVSDIPTLIQQLDQMRKQGTLSEEEFQRKKSDLLARL